MTILQEDVDAIVDATEVCYAYPANLPYFLFFFQRFRDTGLATIENPYKKTMVLHYIFSNCGFFEASHF